MGWGGVEGVALDVDAVLRRRDGVAVGDVVGAQLTQDGDDDGRGARRDGSKLPVLYSTRVLVGAR